MCVGLGIGQGFQPVASFNHQVKKYSRVKKGLLFTMGAGFCVVGLLSIVGIIFAEQIVTVFQSAPDVVEIGTFALRAASVGLVFSPLAIPINMLYQSIRNAEISSFLSLMRSGLLFIPTLFILSHFFGLKGIQLAQPIADVLSGLISIIFIVVFIKNTPNEIDGTGN
jgi:Na+-driven multidrug efflux pump